MLQNSYSLSELFFTSIPRVKPGRPHQQHTESNGLALPPPSPFTSASQHQLLCRMPPKTASRPSAQRTAQKKGRGASVGLQKKSTARLPDASDTSTGVVSGGVGDSATSDNAPVSGAAGDSASGRVAGGLEALGAVAAAAAAAAYAATIEAAAQAAAAAAAAETAAATHAESAGTAGVAPSPAKAKKKKAEPVSQ
ncbi:hypothetical protein OC834_006645 [Tilletia horrida]|uniref:Uncharacterized protein n=1 Tax=Tilletia horrida TaxID=155126 RepID=A0AAN6JJ70_9BASI|nr:hypothetical protein OC834_006645 [Tilletia horrida]KAK0527614.1 hypothetical protein OC842_004809 [Tilletia horrida]